MNDTLQKFMIDNAPVRGEFVELSNTWQQILERHTYPPAVRTLLGEMLSAAALLSANLKFDGQLIMQVHGDGPVKLLVVECDAQLQMRATAKLREGVMIPDDMTLTQMVNASGNGHFVITLDPKDKSAGQQPYQGHVALDGDNMATIIENYMLRSEQLDTNLWLAADDKVTRGLLLQKLPTIGGKVDDSIDLEAWERVCMLANTLKQEELLSTDIQTLMHRLFWEEDVLVFNPVQTSFLCTCSREKVGDMLVMLGTEEVAEALAAEGTLQINCDFCGQGYVFDPEACAQLFLDQDKETPRH